jgi:hypothetical protein
MGIPPYVFQCAHPCCGRRYPRLDVVVIGKTVVDEGAEIAKGPSEADISVCDMEVRCFREFVICVIFAFFLPLRPTLIISVSESATRLWFLRLLQGFIGTPAGGGTSSSDNRT